MLNGIEKNRIKVAFFLNISKNWLGGVNYYKNLINGIIHNPDLQIEPIVFVSPTADMEYFKGFPDIEFVKTGFLQSRRSIRGIIGSLERRLFGVNFELVRFLRQHRVDIISHYHNAQYVKPIAATCWIPDFQHKYLPQFFSKAELKQRDVSFEQDSRYTDCVILSSYDAKRDFEKYIPKYKGKAKVLQFVVPAQRNSYDREELRKKYDIKGRFFYIPNQFWIHKNHKIVLEALALLRDTDIEVYCTGNTEDYRAPHYFEQLMRFSKEHDLQNKFHVLGLIPYEDVQALMQECTALINPSLFEGWNTMVEEAKSLGKRIVLSDLSVHKEQNPAGAVYFNRDSAESLADAMRIVWNEPEDEDFGNNAFTDMKRRERDMVIQYRKILEFAIARHAEKLD